MKRSERNRLRKGLTKSLRKAGVSKALDTSRAENLLNRQLFATLNGNVPVHIDDDEQAYIDDAYSLNPDVYAVVNGITNAASAIPPVVYEVTDENKARKYYRMKHSNRNGYQSHFLRKSQELKEEAFEEVPDSDLHELINRPNPLQAWPEFVENILGFKLVTGNSYTHGVELSDGRFGELWPMPPQWTRIKADKGSETLINGYMLELYGYEKDIPPETVMHLKYWNPDYSYPGSHLYGMSPLKAARRSVRSSNDGRNALSNAFNNMGAAGMLYPEDPDVDGIGPKQQSQIKKHFRQGGTGPENYKAALIMSAKMGWTQFGQSPVDLEIIESGKMSMRDICNVYSYPSELLNDPDNKTNTNKKESRKQLYQEVVIPTLERFYSELNRWLVPRFEEVDGRQYHIDYDVTAIEALQEDVGEKVDWLKEAWWIPPNQKLKEMGKDPIDNEAFDEPWIPMGVAPLSDLAVDPGQIDDEVKRLLNEEYSLNGH